MTQAAAVLIATAGLTGSAPLAGRAEAATPQFRGPFFFTAPNAGVVGSDASPTFVDIDGDGDLDAFVGTEFGSIIYLENAGSSILPVFPSSSTNPFGLVTVPLFSSPAFADLDGDGDFDAFSGRVNGETIYFENTGSSTAPAFASSSANPFGLVAVGYWSSPTFADIDGDGDLDAFIGTHDGNTFYFRNTGSSTAPAFAAASANPFGLVDVGLYSSPELVDIDGDGDLDAFVGKGFGGGVVPYFQNTGSSTAPAFAASSANPFGLANAGNNPTFADLDGDGDLDAFIGNTTGRVTEFQNTGSSTAPAFVAFSSANPFGLVASSGWSKPAFADLDGDGDLDAFIGDYDGNTIYFRNTGSTTAPAFAASSANPFGLVVVDRGNPTFADLDGDGDLDAFIGATSGNTIYFANTGSSVAPTFAAASANPFGLTAVFGGFSDPTFADLDGDGDLDALIGSIHGQTVYFRNTGSSTAPAFAASSANPFGLTSLGNFSNASPAFADLDGDGDLDAFIGRDTGNIIYFQNTGSSTAPAFAASSANPFGLVDVGFFSQPAFADLDGDGDLDAFIGQRDGLTFYFENSGCGTGGVDAGEQCDDGNSSNEDDCLDTCVLNTCGDGFVDMQGPVTEECDDANASNTDDCLDTCALNTCGDGFIDMQGPVTETCDDANASNDDDCPDGPGGTCQPATCGDGFVDMQGPVTEACDDANASNNDDCLNDCTEATCGDGWTCSDAGTCTTGPGGGPEDCDDGNPVDDDACTNLCEDPTLDSDNDGVTAAIENAAPNGGDGNGDGILDSMQPNVTSVPNATDGSYLTIVTDESCPLEGVTAQPLDPPGWTLPFGALAFELPGCESSRVTIYYHGADALSSPNFEYVKQGPNPPGAANDLVYTLSPAAPHMLAFGSADLGFDPAVGFAAFTLGDNVVGDDTGDDNLIVDQGGPGISTRAPAPALGWWGLAGSLLALFGIARRRMR